MVRFTAESAGTPGRFPVGEGQGGGSRASGRLRNKTGGTSPAVVRNKAVSIEQLGPDGTYVPAPRSRFLPVRAEDVTRWVFSEDSSSLVEWEQRLRQWVRDELVSKTDA